MGGPLIIPGVPFNKDRNRLFFFFSWDQLWNTQSTALNKYTMPTALERQGNFSQSVNPNGSPILIRDPSTWPELHDGRRRRLLSRKHHSGEPAKCIGTAMLNLFPLPNTTDPTGQRQYNFTDTLSQHRSAPR